MKHYFSFLAEFWPYFFYGTIVTIQQFLLSAFFGIMISLFAGLARLSPFSPLRVLVITYIELFRGTSLLVQLYWLFFVLPLFGITLEKFSTGVLALSLNLGAYGAEVVRGAVQAVPRGQYEAAIALNMHPFKRMKRIIMPQALLIMIPPWGNLLIELLKYTSLVSLISVADLMFKTKQVNSYTFLSAEAFGTALFIYYILARFTIAPGMRRLEAFLARKMGRSGRHV